MWQESLQGTILPYLKQRLAKYNMPSVHKCPEETVQLSGDARAGWLEFRLGKKVHLDLQNRVATSLLFSYNTTLAQLQAVGKLKPWQKNLQGRVAPAEQAAQQDTGAAAGVRLGAGWWVAWCACAAGWREQCPL